MISFIFKNGRFIEQSLTWLTLLIGVMGTMKVDANRSTLGVTLSRSLADARSSSVVQRAELYVPMTWWLEKATQSLPHNTLIGMDFYRRGRIQHHALSWIQLWPVMRQNRVLSHRVWYPFRRDRLSQRHSLDKHRRDHSQLPALLSPAFFCSFCLGVRSGAAWTFGHPA